MCSLPLSMEDSFSDRASTGTNGLPHNNVSHWIFFLPMTHVFIFLPGDETATAGY